MKIMLGILFAALLLPIAANSEEEENEGKSGEAKSGAFALPAQVNARWQTECGSCHVAFAPGLLPAASWRKVMQGLDKHFETDASLAATENAEITAFLVKYASNRWSTAATPLRITETQGFKREHDAKEVPAAVWQRVSIKSPANCLACHSDAAKGTFNEDRIKVPA
jgi:nitrate/TMAO reductase-like tetraheme cytochrome c subunit